MIPIEEHGAPWAQEINRREIVEQEARDIRSYQAKADADRTAYMARTVAFCCVVVGGCALWGLALWWWL